MSRKKSLRKNVSLVLLVSLFVVVAFCIGCASPRPIPTTYLDGTHQMNVTVGKCPKKPQMVDSDRGGLIGMIVKAGRSSKMKKAMEGINSVAFTELLRQQMTEKLEGRFDVIDEEAPIATVINVRQWGWFLPTTVVGIKTGSYQFIINGDVIVTDCETKKRIGFHRIKVSESLGNDPTPTISQQALLQCIQKFSVNTTELLLQNQTIQ